MFLSIFTFINLYMFRAAMGSSSGGTTVLMRLGAFCLVWMTVWYAGWNSIAARNMQRLPNINTVIPRLTSDPANEFFG